MYVVNPYSTQRIVCVFRGGAYFRLAEASKFELVEEVLVGPREMGNQPSGIEAEAHGDNKPATLQRKVGLYMGSTSREERVPVVRDNWDGGETGLN